MSQPMCTVERPVTRRLRLGACCAIGRHKLKDVAPRRACEVTCHASWGISALSLREKQDAVRIICQDRCAATVGPPQPRAVVRTCGQTAQPQFCYWSVQKTTHVTASWCRTHIETELFIVSSSACGLDAFVTAVTAELLLQIQFCGNATSRGERMNSL